MTKVLITGIAGRMGRLVAKRLLSEEHEVVGIDRRPWPDSPRGVTMVQADIRKRPAENVFRTHRPEVCVHLATVTHFTTRFEVRYRVNLYGTRAVFEHCHKYGVEHAVFVGRHTVYGAAADSPIYHTEEEPPLAGSTYPELSDLVAADLHAGSALWRWPDLTTTVLRVVYTLGPTRYGTLASYLRGPRVPSVLGFDPLFQLMHEADAADAIVSAVTSRPRGVFNVTGPQPIPLSHLCSITGRTRVPIPEPLFDKVCGRFGLSMLPKGAISHIKYPILVDGSLFHRATGFEHDFDEIQTMTAFRLARRSR